MAAIERKLRQDDLDLPESRILLAGRLQGRDAAFRQQLPATGVRNDRSSSKEAIAPGMIRMVVRIDHVADRHAKFVLNVLAHAERLIRQRQRVNHDRPLRPGDHAGRNLCVDLALKPVDVFGNSLAMHIALRGVRPIDSTSSMPKSSCIDDLEWISARARVSLEADGCAEAH